MASRLNPYISFKGNAREAMEFYKDVFGGDAHDQHLRRVRRHGGDRERRDARAARVAIRVHADGIGHPARHGAQAGTSISVSLSGDDGDEMRGYLEKLADGGQVTMPLEKQMWGDEFGMCNDRFGVSWMVNIGPQS